MGRPAKTDPVQAHLDSYPYKRGDDEVNDPLSQHMKTGHTQAWARLLVGGTIGDIEDQHYIEHGKLTSEAEMRREIAAERALDASVARHPAGKRLEK